MRLNKLGYGAGRPDGVMGLNSRRAVRDFQRSIGEYPDGYLTAAQMAKLFAMTDPQAPTHIAPVAHAPVVHAPAAPIQAPATTNNLKKSVEINQIYINASAEATTNQAAPAGSTKRPLLDPLAPPTTIGLSTRMRVHDLEEMLGAKGYKECATANYVTTCKLTTGTLNETLVVATIDSIIHTVHRVITLSAPAPRSAIDKKMNESFPTLAKFSKMRASTSSACTMDFTNNRGLTYKRINAVGDAALTTHEANNGCQDYYAVEYGSAETVSTIEVLLHDGKLITAALENGSDVFPQNAALTEDLQF